MPLMPRGLPPASDAGAAYFSLTSIGVPYEIVWARLRSMFNRTIAAAANPAGHDEMEHLGRIMTGWLPTSLPPMTTVVPMPQYSRNEDHSQELNCHIGCGRRTDRRSRGREKHRASPQVRALFSSE